MSKDTARTESIAFSTTKFVQTWVLPSPLSQIYLLHTAPYTTSLHISQEGQQPLLEVLMQNQWCARLGWYAVIGY